jgi:hypothetical protein
MTRSKDGTTGCPYQRRFEKDDCFDARRMFAVLAPPVAALPDPATQEGRAAWSGGSLRASSCSSFSSPAALAASGCEYQVCFFAFGMAQCIGFQAIAYFQQRWFASFYLPQKNVGRVSTSLKTRIVAFPRILHQGSVKRMIRSPKMTVCRTASKPRAFTTSPAECLDPIGTRKGSNSDQWQRSWTKSASFSSAVLALSQKYAT